MKKRPSLTLREPVKLYETKQTEKSEESSRSLVKHLKNQSLEQEVEQPKIENGTKKDKIKEQLQTKLKESITAKMSPRIKQIWEYFCKKAKVEGEIIKSFNLTRAEVMREAKIGSTNTYRDALRKFQELKLMEIELRPGVNSGSLFTLTEAGIEEIE